MNQTLNPKLFKNQKLRPEVRESLLDIVDEFISSICENSHICVDPVDIVLVGSNAAYNYTDSSDIDLHIIVNFDLVNGSPDSLIQAYYNAERSNFNNKYDFNVKGAEVEVYVEDMETSTVSNGIYSVLNDDWIKFPEKREITTTYTPEEFDRIYNIAYDAVSGKDFDAVKDAINMLYLLRKNSLSTEGEYGEGNLIFKKIRNIGLLKELKDKYNELLSKKLSVENLKFYYERY